MTFCRDIQSKSNLRIIILISIFFTLIFLDLSIVFAQNSPYIGMKPPTGQYGVPLFKKESQIGLSIYGPDQPNMMYSPRSLKREVKIDSTGKEVTIQENVFDMPLHLPAKYSLSDYSRICLEQNAQLEWQKYKVEDMTGMRIDRSSKDGFKIEIPVKIRSKAFQTIFGGDNVSLTVNGQININGGFRHEKRSQVKTAYNRGSDYNFKMQQTQRFRVQGNIGEKVTVSVDQDSERPFDFDNTIKLDYKGYPDEILQSIQAGNISLSLPGTRFVSFSGQNSGLFGIKSEAQVGNLYLTMIASQEKGDNKTKSITGGAEESEYTIKDINYMKGVYFFLDNKYRTQYTKLDESTGLHTYNGDDVITDFEIYKSGPGYEQKEGRVRGWALLDPTNPDTANITDTKENMNGYWIRLDRSDYTLETKLGYIRLNTAVTSDDEMLAIAYKDQKGNEYGDYDFDADQEDIIFLKMLKPKSARPSDETWDLQFRNVYYLGSRNIEEDGFEVKIFYDPASGDDEETLTTEDGAKSYLEVFGLDKTNQNGENTPDNLIDINENTLRLGLGELEFPSLRPFDDPNNTLLPDEKHVSAMYDTLTQSVITNDSKFYIQVKSKNKSASYDLGWNVIEGSEEVTLNGARLAKDTDYIIDYYSGKLTILREEATNPSANVQVNYQQNEMFQLEKKTLLGMRGEYRFWEKSFIGATALYLNQSTLDQKVRPGKGPMRNFIWDVNTSLDFDANFLTKAVDAFPFIETKTNSSVKFEGEVAQIVPNPNTLNNNSTGDKDGVAYIDDFEAAKKITPLGIMKSAWRLSSSPLKVNEIPDASNQYATTFEVYKKRGKLVWYNPYSQVPINEIWPNRDTHNPNTPQVVHVLNLQFNPTKDSTGAVDLHSWGGIMKWLSAGYADQSDSKFLEIWVNVKTAQNQRLHVDLGQISEDIIPNGKLDSEDIPVAGIKNNLLDDGEDVGIDGMDGVDPEDFWDINGNKIRDEGEPISYDDWEYSTASENYEKSSGTENNINDPGGGRYPDSEDFNANGSLDTQNDYFEYSISLSPDHADTMYIDGGKDNAYGWRQYRIPLNEFTKTVGEPDMSRIEYARIWIDSCTSSQSLIRIAEINLVGNDWKEIGVASTEEDELKGNFDETRKDDIAAAVTNTHDNDDYIPPPGVSGVRDRVTQVEAKEQSLVIRIENLFENESAILKKTFYQSESYINYKKLKMFVHGGDSYFRGFSENQTNIELFLRFGADDKNYYEIRMPVYSGWTNNDLEVDLNDLAMLKLEDPANIENFNINVRTKRVVYGTYYRDYSVVGQPSLTNIKQLVLGVRNGGFYKDEYFKVNPRSPSFSGEIWVNELRLSEVKKDKGYAYRARTDIQVADVFSVNGEVNRMDADFHNVNTRFGTGNNETGGNFAGNFALHKFLPKSWGVSLPINFNYSKRESTPKYLPGSDIMVTSDMPKEELDKIRSESESQGLGVSFKKNTRSKNFFIQNTIDQLSVSANTAESHSSSSTQLYNDRTTYTANIGYNINFPKDKYIRPFSWLGKAPIIEKISEIRLFYFPNRFNLRASGNRTDSKSETRNGLVSENQTFLISRSLQTGIQPLQSLSFDFSRDYKTDMRNAEDPVEELKNFRFGELTNLDQAGSAKYRPTLFSWLKANFSYTTNFKWTNNLQQKSTGRSAASNNSTSGSFTFDPDKLVQSMFKKSSSRPKSRPRPGAQNNKQEDKKDTDSGRSLNPFKMMVSGLTFVTSRIDPVSISMTNRNNVSNFGLRADGGMPTWDYMLGFSENPGVESDSLVTNTSSMRETNDLSFSSGLKIINQMNLTFKYSRDDSRSETTTLTGDQSESWYYTENGGFPIPEWQIRWAGLERMSFFKKFASRLSFDHNFSGKKQESWQNSASEITRRTYTKAFRPLLGCNFSLKQKINVTARYNYSENISETVTGGSGGKKSVASDVTVTANYSRSGGFKIPLPFLKNKELKNNIDLQVSFTMSKNAEYQNLKGQDWVETDIREGWSLKPELNYSFSTNVRGGMHFEVGKNRNKRIGETSIQEFGLNVSIAIRGS